MSTSAPTSEKPNLRLRRRPVSGVHTMAMTSAAVMNGRGGIVAIASAERHIAFTTSPPVIVRARLAERERVFLLHYPFHASTEAGFTAFNRRAERGKSGVDGTFHGGGEAGREGAHAGVRGAAIGDGCVEDGGGGVACASGFHVV